MSALQVGRISETGVLKSPKKLTIVVKGARDLGGCVEPHRQLRSRIPF